MDENWNRRYTADSLIEELALLERHYRDGSFRECSCVPEKHLPTIAGLASEMIMFQKDKNIEEFYESLATMAREARTAIEEGRFSVRFHSSTKGSRHETTECKGPECGLEVEKH